MDRIKFIIFAFIFTVILFVKAIIDVVSMDDVFAKTFILVGAVVYALTLAVMIIRDERKKASLD